MRTDNSSRRRYILLLVLLLALGATWLALQNYRDARAIHAVPIRGSAMPERVAAGPAQDPSGVQHRLIACRRIGDWDAVYDLEFVNPYAAVGDAYFGASFDGEDRGIVWGWFSVAIPAGTSRVIVRTDRLDDWNGQKWQSLQAELGVIERCSVHLLGFEQEEMAVVFPVATSDLSA